MNKNVLLLFLLTIVIVPCVTGQAFLTRGQEMEQSLWVDSVFNSLDDRQKVGQLFMIGTYSNLNEQHYASIDSLIEHCHVGGLFFLQGGPGRQINLINHYQEISQVPLLVGMDLEYGLGMRLDSTMQFPKQMTLGAIQNEQFIYNLGAEIARQSKLIGVNINFSPILDINTNPNNPEIGLRSFGEDKIDVSAKGNALMKGLQDHGVISSAKHFPGLGETERASHFKMPVLEHDLERLQNVELYPFKSVMDHGLKSITIGHINFPNIDDEKHLPATLSKNLVTGLLKETLLYKGLIITEPLNQKSVTRYFEPKQANLMAIQAGNDMLLFPEDIPESIDYILKNLAEGNLSWSGIEESVRKILAAKYWAGLNNFQPLEHKYILDQLNNPSADLLQHKLYEHAITVVKNENNILPLRNLETETFASLGIGDIPQNTFQKTLSKYVNFDHFYISKNQKDADSYNLLFDQLKNYSTVIIGIHEISNSSHNNYSVNDAYIQFIKRLQNSTKIIVVVFGNPYSLKNFGEISNLVCTYQDEFLTQSLTPQILFGAISAKGMLPVSVSPEIQVHQGKSTRAIGRLAYSLPEDVGMNSHILERIDLLANEAINDEATPGCQILVAKNGAVVYEKSFGNLTYDKRHEVTNETVYDLASLTKVVATLQTVMFLQDQALLDVNKKASYYLTDMKGTNKEDMVIKDILMHQAGLLTFIPFWVNTLDDHGLKNELYSHHGGNPFNIEITNDLYGISSLQDSIWHWIIDSELRPLKRYRDHYDYKYSDLGFFIMYRLAEHLLNQKLDEFLNENFYQPMGMNFLRYLPLKKYSKQNIAPTEYDTYFRNSLIHGTVHDPGAAMMGGVAGHAGVFGNANDIAKIMQMNLQDGIYGGVQYFQPGTVNRFTKRQEKDNRRGLGWDKPELDNDNGPTSLYSSPETFGHTGFTGTATWVDPVNDLIYIFLSNRIYPSSNNFKLIKNNIRTRIQDIIYQAIEK